MLTHLHVRNLAIVDEIDLELDTGMTVLTGETGAGKSILIDALGLALGDRADSSWVRHGAERAEISASFDITTNPAVRVWLAEQDRDLGDECQIRRVISSDGRSRGYINGQPAPMQQLRELGESLVDIHGQHEHQSLLRPGVQREWLDAFGGYPALVTAVAGLYSQWQDLRERLEEITRSENDREARLDLLRYQLDELDSTGLSAEDIAAIDAEHARQANAGRLLETTLQTLEWLNGEQDHNALHLLNRCVDELTTLASVDNRLAEPLQLLEEARTLTQESTAGLRRYTEHLDIDPDRLQWLEQRIGLLHDLSRKHRCSPAELPALAGQLRAELDAVEHAGQLREELAARLAGVEQQYLSAARQLGEQRRRAAAVFGRDVTGTMQTLGMPGAQFEVSIRPLPEPGPHGMENIEYRVSTNQGLPPQSLARVASGGELSRISLSIQVIAAHGGGIPTLIFDEVDSGIGGGVAEITGRKLRSLAATRQVLCVTHLPQVASLAHHQLQVSKQDADGSVHTRVRMLSAKDRVEEIARMLGGVKITQQTREHAREMLAQSRATPAGKAGSRRPRAKA